MSKTLLTPREMAAYLRISRATLAKWMREGIVPYARVGPRCVRFDLERVMRAVEGLGMDAGNAGADLPPPATPESKESHPGG